MWLLKIVYCHHATCYIMLVLSVFVHGVGVHQHHGTLGYPTLQDQAVVHPDMIINTAVVPSHVGTHGAVTDDQSAVCLTKFLVDLAEGIKFLHVIQPKDYWRVPFVWVTLCDHTLS